MDIQNFILAGDSAGGHLTMSVSMVAALRGFRIPDAILCIYPTISLSFERYFPSLLIGADEEILSASFMYFARSCFLRNGGNTLTNPVASPGLAPDALLKMLP